MKVAGLVKELKRKINKPYDELNSKLGLRHGSIMRWMQRLDRGEDVLKQSGPGKVDPMDQEALKKEVRLLKHGHKRTAGTGELYLKHRDHASRRYIQALADATRRDLEHDRKMEMRRINWVVPGIVWAMDDTEFTRKDWGWESYANQVHVLGARYDLVPHTGVNLLPGPDVAIRLGNDFEENGPPLILKRDNGNNLNHADVDGVLAEYYVIPLNSPTYYPPYNGAIEKTQLELKQGMAERGLAGKKPSAEMIQLCAENVVHQLNHKVRRVLDGSRACAAFSAGIEKAGAYTRRDRKKIYDRIVALATETLVRIGETGHRAEQAAWRMAVETWLQENGLITISRNGKVLPYFNRL